MMQMLLIDDRELVRTMVQRAMVIAGWNVTVQRTIDGAQAEQQVREGLVTCVVVASQLQSGDGLAMVRRFAAGCREQKIPLLMVGTETSLPRRAAALDAGATAWLTKPLDPQALREVLKNFPSPVTGEG